MCTSPACPRSVADAGAMAAAAAAAAALLINDYDYYIISHI